MQKLYFCGIKKLTGSIIQIINCMEKTLFDSITPTIEQETNQAIDKGLENSNDEWRETTLENFKTFCIYKDKFTMNDFRDFNSNHCKVYTHDNRSMGGIVRTAIKNNWIEATGDSIISRVGHKSLLQVWKSLLYKEK